MSDTSARGSTGSDSSLFAEDERLVLWEERLGSSLSGDGTGSACTTDASDLFAGLDGGTSCSTSTTTDALRGSDGTGRANE